MKKKIIISGTYTLGLYQSVKARKKAGGKGELQPVPD